jgi:hypothetical protein
MCHLAMLEGTHLYLPGEQRHVIGSIQPIINGYK